MNIIIVQNIQELKFIINNRKLDNDFSVLPINLEVQTYCHIKKIKHLNTIEFINNEFHKKLLEAGEDLVSKLDYKNLKSLSQQKVLKNFIRKRFYSASFILELINNVSKKLKVNRIIISGWTHGNADNSFKNYFISKIVKNFFKDYEIDIISDQDKKVQKNLLTHNFKIESLKKSKKKTVLFTSLGYNLNRIIISCLLKRFRVIVFNQSEISSIKRLAFKLLGVKILTFSKIKLIEVPSININEISFTFDGQDYSNFLNEEKNIFLETIKILKAQSFAIDNFLKTNDISLIISSIARDFYGYFSESGRKLGIPSLCVSHGTVSESYEKYDNLYKKIITEGVFDGEFDYFSIQSKICEKSLKNFPTNGKNIITGNLIFADDIKNNNFGKAKILYAVTLKDFYGLQFFGVELHCEFYENLKLISKITKEKNLSFIVHLHPSISKEVIKNLKYLFPKIEFNTGNITKSLKRSFATISYSSTVIEDSLMTNVPVILFDQWQRYRHCGSELNPLKKNQPIYYVNSEKDLIDTIFTLKKSENIDFKKVSFGKSSRQNIESMLDKIL